MILPTLHYQVWLGLVYGVNTTLNNIYIVGVSFIGGGNQSTPRKPLTCHKSLTNFIT